MSGCCNLRFSYKKVLPKTCIISAGDAVIDSGKAPEQAVIHSLVVPGSRYGHWYLYFRHGELHCTLGK